MRLIDADKLKRIYAQSPSAPLPSLVTGSEIDNAPTVEAIPIKWIEKWLENIKNDRRYKSEYVELTQDVKRVVYKGTVVIRIPCISDMLEDWENENG